MQKISLEIDNNNDDERIFSFASSQISFFSIYTYKIIINNWIVPKKKKKNQTVV